TGTSLPYHDNSSSLTRTLWIYKVKSVELLGADIAHQKRRPIRSETARRQPCSYNATEILQVGDPFQFTICDANTVDRRIRTKTSIEVDVFAIGRPLCEANSCTGKISPFLRGRIEEHQFLGIHGGSHEVTTVRGQGRPI